MRRALKLTMTVVIKRRISHCQDGYQLVEATRLLSNYSVRSNQLLGCSFLSSRQSKSFLVSPVRFRHLKMRQRGPKGSKKKKSKFGQTEVRARERYRRYGARIMVHMARIVWYTQTRYSCDTRDAEFRLRSSVRIIMIW